MQSPSTKVLLSFYVLWRERRQISHITNGARCTCVVFAEASVCTYVASQKIGAGMYKLSGDSHGRFCSIFLSQQHGDEQLYSRTTQVTLAINSVRRVCCTYDAHADGYRLGRPDQRCRADCLGEEALGTGTIVLVKR